MIITNVIHLQLPVGKAMNNNVTNFIHCFSYLLRLQQIVSVT